MWEEYKEEISWQVDDSVKRNTVGGRSCVFSFELLAVFVGMTNRTACGTKLFLSTFTQNPPETISDTWKDGSPVVVDKTTKSSQPGNKAQVTTYRFLRA